MKFRWKRVCAGLSLFLGLNLAAAKWAQAEVGGILEARGLEFGRQLYDASSLMDAFEGGPSRGRAGSAHRLLVNGAEIALHSGSVALSEKTNLESLVAKVRDNCRSPRGARSAETPILHAPLFEWVGETEAFVYCLKSERPLSLEAISELLESMKKSGDLAEWGTFQGAYFRVQERSVAILTAEIKRGVIPTKMFPQSSDAPGENIAALPAPEGRRVLSVAHNGKPALTIHQSSASASTALGRYHVRLIECGLSVERAKMEHSDSLALVARSSREAFVVVATDVVAQQGVAHQGPSGIQDSQIVVARLPD